MQHYSVCVSCIVHIRDFKLWKTTAIEPVITSGSWLDKCIQTPEPFRQKGTNCQVQKERCSEGMYCQIQLFVFDKWANNMQNVN